MFRVKLGSVEIECDTAADVAAIVDAMGQREGGGMAAPEPRRARKTAAAVASVPGKRRGRTPSIDEATARLLHRRYASGAPLAELAAEAGVGSGGALWARFKALGLPTGKAVKVAAPAEVPIRRLVPGESRATNHRGEPLR